MTSACSGAVGAARLGVACFGGVRLAMAAFGGARLGLAGLAVELLALMAAGLTADLAGCCLLLAVFFFVCGTK